MSTTATLAVESAELKLWPEVIVPELSGPSDPLARSTPVTLKLLLLIEDLAPDAEPPAEPPPDPVALIVPDSFRSVRVSAPAVADTSFRPDIFVTSEDGSAPSPPLVSTLRLKLVPADGLLPELPPPKPNRAGPPDPAVGVWVTVTSVPTP